MTLTQDVQQGTPLFKNLKLSEVKDVSTGSAMRLQFTISDEIQDRDGDVINAKGWVLDSYVKNPVVCWSHKYDVLPVGRAVKTWQAGDALKSIVEFTPDELYDDNFHGIRGSTVFRFYQQGYLNAVSAGFYPISWEAQPASKGNNLSGTHFLKQELLEYSAVPIPSNQNALISRSDFTDTEIKAFKKELKVWAKEAEKLCACPAQDKALGVSEDVTGGFLVGDSSSDKDAVQSELGRLQPPPEVDNENNGDSNMKKGAIPFDEAHKGGTPLAKPNATWNAADETAKATEAAHLKAMHAGFTGGDDSDKDNYVLPHHGGEPPHPVHLKAVKAIAKKFTPEEKTTKQEATQPGDAPGLGFSANDNQVIQDHVAQHLTEFDEPLPWDAGATDEGGSSEDDQQEPSKSTKKGITDTDKANLIAGINKENLQDLSAYHRRLHMFAAQGNIMTGFTQADMNWLHAQIESAMCKLHKQQKPPTDCADPSPLQWKKSVKAAKPSEDDDGEDDGADAEEKCSHITSVTGQIAERESNKGKKAEAGEDDKEDEDEDVEPVTPPKDDDEKSKKKSSEVTKVGRKLSKANEDALNEALGHFSEGFGQHDKAMQAHVKVTKANEKAGAGHEAAMDEYQKGIKCLKDLLVAIGHGDKPADGDGDDGGQDDDNAPAAAQTAQVKSESEEVDDDLITFDPHELGEVLKETITEIKKQLGLLK
jgi:hypothetical protein